MCDCCDAICNSATASHKEASSPALVLVERKRGNNNHGCLPLCWLTKANGRSLWTTTLEEWRSVRISGFSRLPASGSRKLLTTAAAPAARCFAERFMRISTSRLLTFDTTYHDEAQSLSSTIRCLLLPAICVFREERLGFVRRRRRMPGFYSEYHQSPAQPATLSLL